MTYQTQQPLESFPSSAMSRSARELANIFTDGDGDLYPEYQRGSVWSNEQRMGLVRSWLMGVPIPAIILNDRIFGSWPKTSGGPVGGFAYAVIDGKQRLEAAIAWFNSNLAVPASWFSPEAVEQTVDTDDGAYVYYNGLAISEQRHTGLLFKLPTVEASLATIQAEAQVYLLVNGEGVPQTDENIANAASIANS